MHAGVRSPKGRGSLGACQDPKRPQGTREEAGFLSPGTHRGQDGGEGSPPKYRREGREVAPQPSIVKKRSRPQGSPDPPRTELGDKTRTGNAAAVMRSSEKSCVVD